MVARIPAKSKEPPKNKDDEDLEHRLVNFLHARHVPGSGEIGLDAHGGTVIVHGPLISAHAKWLCIECCRHVAGVINLVDETVIEPARLETDAPPAERCKSRV